MPIRSWFAFAAVHDELLPVELIGCDGCDADILSHKRSDPGAIPGDLEEQRWEPPEGLRGGPKVLHVQPPGVLQLPPGSPGTCKGLGKTETNDAV